MNKLTPISLALLGAISQISTAGEDPVTSTRYEKMRSEFLTVDPNYFSIAEGGTVSGPSSTMGFYMKEKPANETWSLFGARYDCTNEYGDSSACFYTTGGRPQNYPEAACGTANGGSWSGTDPTAWYNLAIAHPEYICTTPNVEWSGWEFWLNAWDGFDYVADGFPSGNTFPINRLCAELEFDANRLTATTDYIVKDYKHSQIVNPNDIHPNLKYIAFGWGTYTAPKTSATRTGDEELGGTYQTGGNHFYHNGGYANQQPLDKVYALDEDTVVACVGPSPTGVRADMRPTYVANPLMTVLGEDEDGITNAYSYLNYLTRIYFKYGGTAKANYPWTLKINKIWMMYEENEVFAMGKRGSILGVDMIKNGETAYHPFTLYNWAKEDRTYKVFMSAAQTLPLDSKVDYYKLYWDVNKNKSVDSEDIEISPYSEIDIPADTDMYFVIAHAPKFDNYYHSPSKRYGKHFAQSTVTFQEKGRMRSASYATRTWEGTTEEIADKEAFFKESSLPSPDSMYATYAQYNQDYNKETNPMLIRNQPDFKRALAEHDQQSPPEKISTQNIGIQIRPKQ